MIVSMCCPYLSRSARLTLLNIFLLDRTVNVYNLAKFKNKSEDVIAKHSLICPRMTDMFDFIFLLQPELPRDMKMITTCLHMLIMFTSANKWKILRGKSGGVFEAVLSSICLPQRLASFFLCHFFIAPNLGAIKK